MKKLSESVWSDIHKRSNGSTVRKEEDIELMDIDTFFDYINSIYQQTQKNKILLKRTMINFKDNHISVPIVSMINLAGISNTLSLNLSEKENEDKKIMVSPISLDVMHDLKDLLKYHFTLKDINKNNSEIINSYVTISPRDGSDVTHKFFIELIDFIIERVKDPKLIVLFEKI